MLTSVFGRKRHNPADVPLRALRAQGPAGHRHVVNGLNVGQLRALLEGLPDHLPVIAEVPDDPGGTLVVDQVVTGIAHISGIDDAGEPYIGADVRLACDYPTGTYPYRDDPA